METEGRILMAEPVLTTPPTKSTELVRSHFEDQEQKIGHTSPQNVAHAIVGEGSTFVPKLTRIITRMPTKEFLYEGAKETLGDLLRSGDKVIVWTQGDTKTQLWKIASSGIGALRKDLNREDRHRISVFSSENKFVPLSTIFDRLEREGFERIIIVDDKSENIVESSREIESWKSDDANKNVEITPVWVNQGRTKDQIPPGFTLQTFKQKFTTVDNVREILSIKDNSAKKTAWLIDFDHTLLNTAKAKENLFKIIAETLSPTRVELSPGLINEIGVNGNVRNAQEFKEGVSNGKVIKIDTDRDTVVIKYNPQYPNRIIKEIRGYMLLADTPLKEHLLSPRVSNNDEAMFIVLPYFNGVQLRSGLRTGILPQDIVIRTMNELMNIKEKWWSSQNKIASPQELSSMQRDESFDTVSKINLLLPQLSAMLRIPIEDLWNTPIISGGTKLPSLSEILSKVTDFINTPPPFTILTHGDAAGGNILINPASQEWKLIDAEWTGYSDPAEAFVRMAKHVSTTTIASVDKIALERKTEGINAELTLDIPETSKALQAISLSRVSEFSNKLEDPDFGRRVSMYLAGSYLREAALTLKRGYPELSIFAIIKAGEALLSSRNGY